MNEHITRAISYIAAMRVDGENQELAVAAKNELKVALAENKNVKHEFTINKEESA